MGRHKKTPVIELNEEEINLPQKNSISKLSGKHIIQFSEDSYELSLRRAFEWANERNKENSKFLYKVKLLDYYMQSFKRKSILASYDIFQRNT